MPWQNHCGNFYQFVFNFIILIILIPLLNYFLNQFYFLYFRRHEAPLPSPICTQNVFCSLVSIYYSPSEVPALPVEFQKVVHEQENLSIATKILVSTKPGLRYRVSVQFSGSGAITGSLKFDSKFGPAI